MDVTEIVKDWLKSHGADGLCSEGCGCSLDDFMPCGGEDWAWTCVPARKVSEDEAIDMYEGDPPEFGEFVPMKIEEEEV